MSLNVNIKHRKNNNNNNNSFRPEILYIYHMSNTKHINLFFSLYNASPFNMKMTFLGDDDMGISCPRECLAETPNKTNLQRATSYNWYYPHHSFYFAVF